jgi:hypothetical protein
MVLLNPVDEFAELTTLEPLRDATRENLCRRGDAPDDISGRVKSIDEERPAWEQLLELGATEYPKWGHAEYKYAAGDRKALLVEARRTLVGGNPRLGIFLKRHVIPFLTSVR